MNSKTALKTVLILSIAGLLFSGYLSFYELFVPAGCLKAIVNCGTNNPMSDASIPACVYGFIMYLIIFIVSIVGLKKKVE